MACARVFRVRPVGRPAGRPVGRSVAPRHAAQNVPPPVVFRARGTAYSVAATVTYSAHAGSSSPRLLARRRSRVCPPPARPSPVDQTFGPHSAPFLGTRKERLRTATFEILVSIARPRMSRNKGKLHASRRYYGKCKRPGRRVCAVSVRRPDCENHHLHFYEGGRGGRWSPRGIENGLGRCSVTMPAKIYPRRYYCNTQTKTISF